MKRRDFLKTIGTVATGLVAKKIIPETSHVMKEEDTKEPPEEHYSRDQAQEWMRLQGCGISGKNGLTGNEEALTYRRK